MKVCIIPIRDSEMLANQLQIDVLVDARRAAALPQPKGLGDRIS